MVNTTAMRTKECNILLVNMQLEGFYNNFTSLYKIIYSQLT